MRKCNNELWLFSGTAGAVPGYSRLLRPEWFHSDGQRPRHRERSAHATRVPRACDRERRHARRQHAPAGQPAPADRNAPCRLVHLLQQPSRVSLLQLQR